MKPISKDLLDAIKTASDIWANVKEEVKEFERIKLIERGYHEAKEKLAVLHAQHLAQ